MFWVSSWTRDNWDSLRWMPRAFSMAPLFTGSEVLGPLLQPCLYLLPQQGPDEAAVLREEKNKKKSSQSGGLSI
jgi:hypothetical protein